jgi:hypothetical protein
MAVGALMVRFATAFKACRRAYPRYGGALLAAQFALLLAWTPTRLLFLALERAAVGTCWAHAHASRRWG